MHKYLGHRYRVRFSILLWVVLLVLFEIAPSNAAFVHNPNNRILLQAAMWITVGFTILTFVLWLVERVRQAASKKVPGVK